MNDLRRTGVPGDGAGTDRTALWVVEELGLAAVVGARASCRATRHHPPVRGRIHVPVLERDRLRLFENDDPVHGPSGRRGRGARRQGGAPARPDWHRGARNRHAGLRARLRGSARARGR